MCDGETIVLGGLLQEEDRRTKVTIPWIGDIPFLGNLLSSFKTQRVTTEVILTITPHIVNSLRLPGPGGRRSGPEPNRSIPRLHYSPCSRSK